MRIGQRLLLAAIGIYLLGFGVLCGTAIERVRFGQERTALARTQQQALRDWNAWRMTVEKQAGGADSNFPAAGVRW